MKRIVLSVVAGAVVAGHVPFPAPARAQGVRANLTSDGGVWAGSSGSLRLRGERWTNFGAGRVPAGADTSDAFGLARAMLKGELHARDWLLVAVELKSSLASHRTLAGGVRTGDKDQFDVQQAYAQLAAPLGGARFALRAGRFELSFGRERLVGALDWVNTRRTFQGVSLRATSRLGEATLFTARPVVVRRHTPNIGDSTKVLYGLYLGRAMGARRAELYWLRNMNGGADFNGKAGYERRHTFGGRLVQPPAAGRFDGELEAAWQTGNVGSYDVSAWMATAVVGRSFRPAALRIYAALDAASGDSGGAGGELHTFDQLFPTGHAHLGYADFQGRQNVVALSAGVAARPLGPATTVLLDLWDFRRAQANDALYGTDGAVLRTGVSPAKHVGSEVDLTVRHVVGHLTVQAGASRYFAGPFLEDTGAADDITFLYGQVTVAF